MAAGWTASQTHTHQCLQNLWCWSFWSCWSGHTGRPSLSAGWELRSCLGWPPHSTLNQSDTHTAGMWAGLQHSGIQQTVSHRSVQRSAASFTLFLWGKVARNLRITGSKEKSTTFLDTFRIIEIRFILLSSLSAWPDCQWKVGPIWTMWRCASVSSGLHGLVPQFLFYFQTRRSWTPYWSMFPFKVPTVTELLTLLLPDFGTVFPSLSGLE